MMEQTSDSTAAVALSVGARLAQLRIQHGFNIAQVAEQLRLTGTFVGYIEQDQFAKLPGRTYVRGYLRAYARMVGIDEQGLLADFEAQVAGQDIEPQRGGNPLTKIKPQVKPSDPLMRWSSLLVLILILALTSLWWRGQQENSTGFNFNRGLQELLGEEPVLDSGLPAAAAGSEPSSFAAAELSLSVEPEQAAPAQSQGERNAVSAGANRLDEAAETGSRTGAAPAIESAVASDAALNELRVGFSGTSWLEVRDARGEILFTGIREPGENLQLEAASFDLLIGNAQAVNLSYNGAPLDLAPHTNNRNVAQLKLGL